MDKKVNIELINNISEALYKIIHSNIPTKIDVLNCDNDELKHLLMMVNNLIESFSEVKEAIIPLSQGDLDVNISSSNFLASPFKQLQSSLKHLTWQTEQIAKGDFNQRVDFMGDFSKAFNHMIDELDKAKKEIITKNEQLIKERKLLESLNKELLTSKEKLKENAKKLEMMNDELEMRVEERTKEVQKLLQLKDEFINQLSHDLKTPLSPLINLIPIIKKKTTDDKVLVMVDIIQRAAYRLKELVNKTLEIDRLNSPYLNLNVEHINLHDKINKVASELKLLFHDNIIDINQHIDDGFFVYADNVLLDELLVNLLTNSVKYSIDKKKCSIFIDAKDEKGFIIVSIKDDGIGLTNEQIDHVFDEFYKVDLSRHDLTSHGLGLAISKRIVESFGGTIWVESDGPGKGSTFYFTLRKHE